MKNSQDTLQNSIEKRRRERKLGPMSQAKLARSIGVSRSYITLLEKGLRKPSSTILFRLSKALGCTVEEIYRLLPPEQSST